MKPLIIISTLLLSLNTYATQLHQFKSIQQTLTSGKPIHLVIDFSHCQLLYKAQTNQFNIGMVTPRAWRIADSEMTASSMHFTLNNPLFEGKPVYEYLTYTIKDPNYLTVHYQVLNAQDFTPLSNINDFQCLVDQGVKVYS